MKLLRRSLFILLSVVFTLPVISQDLSETLFRVGEHPVTVGEFAYLFTKNHQHKPEEFSKAKIEEYLDLYIRYKLKVAEALDRGMDTTSSFVREFETYREELLRPHLGDGAILDSLVEMAYQRMKEEIRAAHILVQVAPDASPADTLAAWNKILEARTRALKGEDFAMLAGEYSDEPGAGERGGDLGYFTAMQMVFPFEQAAYTTPVDEISAPVRTRFGYHIVKVLDRRPSRGEVEVSHIMIRESDGARDRIFEIHDRLRKGMDWNEVCSQYSEDANTRANGGRLRPFGVGALNAAPDFQEMAFALRHPGDISDPVHTPYGWHILRLEAKIPVPPLGEIQASLAQRVRRDERMNVAVNAQRRRLLAQYGYQENAEAISAVLQETDTTAAAVFDEVLFSLGDQGYTAGQYDAFLRYEGRATSADRQSLDAFVDKKLRNRVEEEVLRGEPDYRWLLQEYYEGILLFEIMESEIWNRAIEDSVGQQRYYDAHVDDYQAGERVTAVIYSGADRRTVDELKQLLGETGTIRRFAIEHAIQIDSGTFERNDRSVLASVPWQTGVHELRHRGLYYVVHVREMVPPGQQDFQAARPSVISDYQTYLEDAWIQELKRKFGVRINKKAKKRAIKHLLHQ